MREHDIVVAGAGHNGLTAAAYLAKAGPNVGVYEARDFIGGGAQTRETTIPGYKQETDSIAHLLIQANPMITQDELGLRSKYGLEYIYPDVPYAQIFPDETYFCIYSDVDRTCESIAKISPRDAEAYKRFYELSRQVLGMMAPSLFSPAPPLGQTLAVLEASPEGQEIARCLLMSAYDVVNEWFTDERVKVGILKLANEGMMAPEVGGTGLWVFLVVPFIHDYGVGTPHGGGIELANSLACCVKANGGEVLTEMPVTKIITSGGRATGLMAGGEEIRARKGVISSLHVKRLLGMVDCFPDDLVFKVKRTNPSSHSTITSNYALIDSPKYKVGGDADRAFLQELLPLMDGFRQHYDDCRLGIPPRQPVPYIACHTLYDDSKAPDGHHCIQFYDPAPYNLRDGGPARWDEIKDEQEGRKLAWLRSLATNMGEENILGRSVLSPLDLERYSPAYVDGDIMTLGSDLWQFLGNRPVPALGHYETPIDGLYVAGPTTHPGGGMTGGGRAPAQVIMERLGIEFEKVID